MSDHQFRARARTLQNHETDHTTAIDAQGSRFVNDSHRWSQAVAAAPGDFAVGPCDAIHLSAAATITGLLAENDSGDTPVAFVCAAGITRLAFRRITIISTGTVTALFIRRPEAT